MSDNKKKKYVVNLNIPRDGGLKKTIELNISSKPRRKPLPVAKNDTPRGVGGFISYVFLDSFFGWRNIKWLLSEIAKIYSAEPSYFSKKRVESSIAFIIGQFGMIFYFCHNYESLVMSDLMLWASAEFVIAGYYVNKIQSEKKEFPDNGGDYFDPEDYVDPNDPSGYVDPNDPNGYVDPNGNQDGSNNQNVVNNNGRNNHKDGPIDPSDLDSEYYK